VKEEKKLTFTELVSLAPADLFEQAQGVSSMDKAIKTANDRFKKNLKFSAKVVAAMKRLYTSKVNSRDIPADTSFKEYFKQNAGGTVPARIEALAALFNSLVETNLLKESNYDAAAVDWLEKANAIIAAARKLHGDKWKTCDEVLDVINALSNPGDALTELKEIRKRQTDAEAIAEGKTAAGDETKPRETTPLTLDVAVAFITASFSAAGLVPKDRQAQLCAALFKVNDAWANNDLTENRRNELDKQVGYNLEHNLDPAMEVTLAGHAN
jgi:hypothetical protein